MKRGSNSLGVSTVKQSIQAVKRSSAIMMKISVLKLDWKLIEYRPFDKNCFEKLIRPAIKVNWHEVFLCKYIYIYVVVQSYP